MNKSLSDLEIEELKELLVSRSKVATYIAILGAIATLLSAFGTAVATIILAIKTKG